MAFFATFLLMSDTMIMNTYGEFEHTYNLVNSYMVLAFFTFSKILIENLLMMLEAEYRFFMK
jgi:hypothetical protein